jgi:hypothetical protein
MTFDYRHLIDKSVLDILKKILEDIQSNEISDDRSIYISFRTNAQGVVLSKPVKQKYPKEITIILQHQFKNLTVLDEKFTVNITFSGITETVEVPFNTITSFLDPAANFGFQFAAPNEAKLAKSNSYVNKADILPSKFKLTDNKKAKINNKEATVVAFDKFRKKSEEGSIY